MKQKHLTIEDILNLLRGDIELYGSQAKCAEALGVTQGYINDLLKRKREPGPKILDALGLQKVIVYTEKESKK